jgi:nucleotide-binding universal stress UspA family protein
MLGLGPLSVRYSNQIEAERYPADLLVLGVHRASAYASHLAPKIAFQVIAAAPCAVLTISS